MFDKFKEECGVVGVCGHPEAGRIAADGLFQLQHRGQEAAGVAVLGDEKIKVQKGLGLVRNALTPSVTKELKGQFAIGHNRYATQGEKSGDKAVLNAQPFYFESRFGPIALAHNGNVTNTDELRVRLALRDITPVSTSDSEVILLLIAHAKAPNLLAAIKEALLEVEGAFALVILSTEGVYAIRDKHGFKPLVLGVGFDNGRRTFQVIASETCALDHLGAKYVREIQPGEIFFSSHNTSSSDSYGGPAPESRCVFEHVYFSRPDSVVFGRFVMQDRQTMGRFLAQTHTVEADAVVAVPDSGIAAAEGYSMESRIPLVRGIIRNHYVGRTFIEGDERYRDEQVQNKFNPVHQLLKGKRVVLVDDSIVRGTTLAKIVGMVRESGATEVHVRISCPPTTGSCFYGVDTPSESKLIANRMSLDETRKFLGANSLGYLPLEKLQTAVNDGQDTRYCYACYTRQYPTPVGHLIKIAKAQPA
ncbi:MAG: amidophosphoribosyltransferase [Candidatus Doudnabacteria bacterium]|nr:amidophosphoribosyltransferase [Candidatus Doudnabacteria bacterium]